MRLKLEETLQKISAKSGISLEDVKKAHAEAKAALPSSIPDAKKDLRALQVINSELLAGSKSPAVAFQGVIIGVGDCRDMMSGRVTTAMDAYATNPTQAEQEGLVRVEEANGETKVIVLDNLAKFKNGNDNPNFGKDLKPSYTRDVRIVAKSPEGNDWKSVKFQLRGELATQVPPMNKVVDFRALGNLEEGLRSSSVTEFKVNSELSDEEVMHIIENTGGDNIKSLDECEAYHRSQEGTDGFYDRYVITEGTLEYLKPAVEGKNRFMLVSDPTMAGENVSCYIPTEVADAVNLDQFGRQSLLTIIAQPGIGKKWDSENKVQLDEEVLTLNVMGVLGVPGMIKAPGEE